MEEKWQEEQKLWNLSPFDSELVWAARSGMDWWAKEHSGLARKKQKTKTEQYYIYFYQLLKLY